VVKQLGKGAKNPVSRNQMFPGARTSDFKAFEAAFNSEKLVSSETAKRLLALYGTRAADILDLVKATPDLGELFDPASSAIAAELIFAVDKEFAETLADVFSRRILLAYEPGHGLAGVARAAQILGAHLGWNQEQQDREIAEYNFWLDHLRIPETSGARV
jgi:glycerol-3-phosphate dehydrogenase